jgi:hypothetical protein
MSASLYIQGYQDAKGKDLLEICDIILDKISSKLTKKGVHVNYGSITPDGDHLFNSVGVINYYKFENWMLPLEDLVKELKDFGLDLRSPKLETSQLHNCPVYRIEITHNPWANFERAPELNVSQGNIPTLRAILGKTNTPDTWEVAAVLENLEKLGSNQINSLTRPHTENKENELHIINCGLTFDQINRYSERCEAIAKYAKNKGYTKLYLA